MRQLALEEHSKIIQDKYIAFNTLISENKKKLERIAQEFNTATELSNEPIYSSNILKIKQHTDIQMLFQKLISKLNLKNDGCQQTSENTLINIRNVLSLATYSAEIERSMLEIDQDFSMDLDQKINKLFEDGNHFLIEPGIDLFADIHSHLVSLSIFCACIGAYLLWYATVSQTALFAATIFIAITVALLSLLIVFRYQNAQKSKESVSDILFEIFEKLRNYQLKFTSSDMNDLGILLLKQECVDTDQRDYAFWFGFDKQKSDGESITSEEISDLLKKYTLSAIRQDLNDEHAPHSPDRSQLSHRAPSASVLNDDGSQSASSFIQGSFGYLPGAEPLYFVTNLEAVDNQSYCDSEYPSFVVLKSHNSKAATRPIESNLNSNNTENHIVASGGSLLSVRFDGAHLALASMSHTAAHTGISDLSNSDTSASDYNMLEVKQPISPTKKWTQIGGLGFFATSLVLGRTALASSNQGILIAAVGSASHVAILGMLTSMCILPLFLMGQFLINKSLPAHSLMRDVSYALLYVFNLFLSIKTMMYLAFMMSYPIMNMFALYSMVGTGMVPFLALGLALIYTFDSYQKLNADHPQLENSVSDPALICRASS